MRKSPLRRPLRALTLACALAVTLLPAPAPAAPAPRDKMKAEEVVAKHLESIGPEAARSAVKSLIVIGTSRASFKARSTSGAVDGQVVIASVKNKVVLGMKFDSPNYPGERFGFDGKKFTVGYLTPGVRSPLGNFALTNEVLFKEGLLGGTLSSAWALLNVADRKSKLEYAGTDKVNNRPAHKLKYYPNKGTDLEITLFIDADTFHHVRTEYSRIIGARLGAGGIDRQAVQNETRYKIVEEFSDFKKEGQLTLPHSYTLQLEINKTQGSSLDKWDMNLSQFAYDQEVADSTFNVESD
ncbi:MAG TPA: hypothetical protein VGX48_04865 [Pyrinomonadaceae bacterium]|jgi:hypothetical protein|nr:hypothetical protein [Pyrinomonadaceae bacterium]